MKPTLAKILLFNLGTMSLPSVDVPLPCNCLSIGGIVCISLAAILGLLSIIFTAKAWKEDTYYDQTNAYLASGFGAICLFFGVIAYVLTFLGAKGFRKQHQDDTSNGNNGFKWLMITSWIFFGIGIINGATAIAVGVTGGDVSVGFIVYIVLWAIIGWALMFSYAEIARRSSPGRDSAVLPRNAKVAIEQGGDGSSMPQMGDGTTTVTTKTVTVDNDGTRNMKTVTRTTNPDGSVVVEETFEEMDW